jgi:O-succinylbenzoate synthase
VVVSSALETSVGLAAGVALAAALPSLPYACGLATASLLAADLVTEPLRPRHGHLPVQTVAADSGLLEAAAASGPVTEQWRQRLDAVRAVAPATSGRAHR